MFVEGVTISYQSQQALTTPFLSMSTTSTSVNNTLIIGMVSRLFHIYDIRKMVEPVQTRESSLKFMTWSLACMADGKGAFFSHSSLYCFQASEATDPHGI